MEAKDPASMRDAAKAIAQLGPQAVVVKGGHLGDRALDLLYFQGAFHEFPGRHIDTANTSSGRFRGRPRGCLIDGTASTNAMAISES